MAVYDDGAENTIRRATGLRPFFTWAHAAMTIVGAALTGLGVGLMLGGAW